MDVIRCDEPSYLIWKWHPEGTISGNNRRENAIRLGSSLRVKEGSVAAFVNNQNGIIQQDYIEGPYDGVLSTNNLPILSRAIGLAFHGESPFQAEIYFINLAQLVQVKYAVPYFDVFDPRFLDFGVPTAVRGTITFHIVDYRRFVELHRLESFSMTDFQNQIKDAVIRSIKSVVSNAPEEYGIPVVQLERKIDQINDIVQAKLMERFKNEFGVTITSVDIAAIDIDKASDGYQQLKAVTKDVTTATMRAKTEVDIAAMRSDQELDSYERKRIIDNATAMCFPPPIPQSSPATSQISKTTYNVAINGQSAGPFAIEALRSMIDAGMISIETLVWTAGMSEWKKICDVDELKLLMNGIPPIPQ